MIKQANGADAVNFRKMAESMSFDLDKDNAIKVSQIINPVDGPDKNPFEKFSSGKWGTIRIKRTQRDGFWFNWHLLYIAVTLYHEGDSDTDSDTETIALWIPSPAYLWIPLDTHTYTPTEKKRVQKPSSPFSSVFLLPW